MNIKLTPKDKIQVSNSEDIYEIMQRILLRENRIDREKEHFWIVGMNQAGVILYIELVSMGSVKGTLVEPMNVFRVAILKGATRVIAVHNHPTGNLQPSKADEEITDRLIQVGKIIDIRVEDHLIISPVNYLSFKDIGLMSKLEASTDYVPTFLLIEKVRREEQALREEIVKTEKSLRTKAEKKQKETEKRLHSAIKYLVEKQIAPEQIALILDIPIAEVKKALV